MLSRLIICTSLIIATSCSEQSKRVKYGTTTREELTSELGEPEKIENPKTTIEVLVYKNNQKFQVTKKIVVAGMRDPKNEEKSLLYWKHTYKDCQTTTTVLKVSDGSDLQAHKQFGCSSLGQFVVYDPNIDQVIRVVDHVEK